MSEAEQWASKLGRPELRYFIEDAIDVVRAFWDQATLDRKREYLQFQIDFKERCDGSS